MRVIVTADLHYDLPQSKPAVKMLAERILQTGADVLVLLGDLAGADYRIFRECLDLFEGFSGRKLLVPGNHCLWCLPGENSLQRYEKTLPSLAAEAGFTLLDHQPVTINGCGFVGSIGWYDYSYRDEGLGIPLEFYRAKVSPGAAVRLKEFHELVERYKNCLTDRQYSIVARWMDGLHVRLGMSDEQFLEYLLEKFSRQLEDFQSNPAVRRIVAFMHHLPFRQLLPKNRPDRFVFAFAYLGSERFGEVLLKYPKVTDVFCAHSHWYATGNIGKMRVINVGSRYLHKRFEILEI